MVYRAPAHLLRTLATDGILHAHMRTHTHHLQLNIHRYSTWLADVCLVSSHVLPQLHGKWIEFGILDVHSLAYVAHRVPGLSGKSLLKGRAGCPGCSRYWMLRGERHL